VAVEHLVDIPGRRLAIAGWLGGQFRGDADTRKWIGPQVEQLDHAAIDRFNVGHREQASADARLVREQEHPNRGGPDATEGLADPGEKNDVGWIVEVGHVLDERAVAIEEDRLQGIDVHARQMPPSERSMLYTPDSIVSHDSLGP
jgi:hypothetical protein